MLFCVAAIGVSIAPVRVISTGRVSVAASQSWGARSSSSATASVVIRKVGFKSKTGRVVASRVATGLPIAPTHSSARVEVRVDSYVRLLSLISKREAPRQNGRAKSAARTGRVRPFLDDWSKLASGALGIRRRTRRYPGAKWPYGAKYSAINTRWRYRMFENHPPGSADDTTKRHGCSIHDELRID